MLIHTPLLVRASNESIWARLYRVNNPVGHLDFYSKWRFKTNFSRFSVGDRRLLMDLQRRCYLGENHATDLSDLDFFDMNMETFDDIMFNCAMIEVAEDLAQRPNNTVKQFTSRGSME